MQKLSQINEAVRRLFIEDWIMMQMEIPEHEYSRVDSRTMSQSLKLITEMLDQYN